MASDSQKQFQVRKASGRPRASLGRVPFTGQTLELEEGR